MKKKVLKIVLPISILLIGAIVTLCVILFQNKNPYELKTENFETTIEFNGDVDFNALTIYNTKTKETITANHFTIVSCSATNSIGEKILVIQYNNQQFTIPFKVKYKVDFYLDEQILSSQFVTNASEIIVPENVTKTGYEFISWDISIPENLENNLTLNAIMSSTTLTVPKLQAIPITYGTKLSEITLPNNINGRWEFVEDNSNYVGDVGTRTFDVKFVPSTSELVERYSTIDLVVEQKELTFTILQDEFDYNGSAQFPIYSLPVSGLNVTEMGHATNYSQNPYDYSLVINETNYRGYCFGIYKINKANVNLKIDTEFENNQVNYNQEFDLTYQITGFENEELLDLTFDNHLNLNAGIHHIGATSNNPNINLNVEKAVIEVLPISLNPAPANPTLSTTEVPAIYGDKLSTITFKDNFANGKWEWVNPNLQIDKINDYTATAKFTPFSNNFKAETREIAVNNISKKTLSIKVTDNKFTYDGEAKTIAYNIENGTFNNLNVVGNVEKTNAGTYVTTLSIEEEFYQGSVNTELIINKANPVADFTSIFTQTWFTGIKLSNITLNEGYKWNSPSTSIDVGTQTYSATYTPTDTNNYNSVEGNFKVIVNKANATISNVLNNYTFAYTGNPHTISGIQPNHNEEILQYAYSKDDTTYEYLTNAGTYDVTITLPESAHYNRAQATTTVVIEKADLNVQLASLTATYEDTLSVVKLPEVSNGVWNWKENSTTPVGDAGEQKHFAIFTPNNENYNLVEFETTILVAPKNLTIEITTNKFTYNGENHKLIFIIKDNNQKDYSNLEIIGNNEQINASTYDLTLIVKNPNYKATKTAQLIIEKASPIPTLPTNLTATYLDLVKNVNLPTAENGTWKWNTTDSTSVGNAGINSFSATFTFKEEDGCDNFFDYTTDLTINVAKKVVVAPTLKSTSETYTGNKITAQLNNDTNSHLYNVTENGWTNVSNYNVKLSLVDANNYKWKTSNEQTLLLPFSITKAQAVISDLNIIGWEFNQPVNGPTASSNFGIITYTYSTEEYGTYTSTIPTNAGSYFVKATIANDNNYDGCSSVKSFNITKAFLTAPTILPKPYTGSLQKADVTPSTLYTIVNQGGTQKGSYDVILTITNSNYQWRNETNVLRLTFNITSVVNSWSVEKITMPNWTYGETPKIETITATYSPVTVQYKLTTQGDEHYTTTLPTNAGSYVAKYYASGSESYNSLTEYIYFTILKKGIDVPQNISTPYTGNEITAEFDASTIYYIDTENSTLSAINVSTNTIKFVISNSNYKWNTGNETVATITFSITQATTTISDLTIGNWTYSEIAKNPTANSNFGTLTYKYSTEQEGTYSSAAPTDAGTYYVKAFIEGTPNYSSTESEPFEFTIRTATTLVSNVTIGNWTYNGIAEVPTEKTPTATTNFGKINFVYSNEENGTYSSTVPTEAGTYYVKAVITGNSNFSSAESEEPTSFTIGKLGIDIPSIPEQTYTGSLLTANITESNLYTVDTENSTLSATDANDYTIKFVISNPNYKWNTGDETTAIAIFKIKKATPVISGLTIQNVNYGTSLNPSASSTFGLPVVFKYSSTQNGEYLTTAPTNVGSYFVKAIVEESDNFNKVESNTLSFSISKATANISSLSINDWTYLKDAVPNYSITRSDYVNDVDIVVEYLENESWSTTKPTTPGTYEIRAKINGTTNYNGCDYFTGNTFEISQPNIKPSISFNQTSDFYLYVDNISSIITKSAIIEGTTILVEGFWEDEEITYKNGTEATFTATFVPTDTLLLQDNPLTTTATFTVKSVAKIGSTQYATIESALNAAVSGNIVYVPADNTGKVQITKDCEIKSGVTLSFLYTTDESSRLSESAAPLSGANYGDYKKDVHVKTSEILIKNGITLTNYGTIEVAGQLSGGNGGTAYSGHTAGQYVEILMDSNSKIKSTGKILINGYINAKVYNNGSLIIIDKGEISLPFILHDYHGGSYMYAAYSGEISWFSRKSKEVSPFIQYQFRNISSKLRVNNAGSIYAYANLTANDTVQYSKTALAGSGENSMIQFNAGAYLEAHYNPATEVCDLDFFGGFTLNALLITINVLGTNFNVDSTTVYFPLNCYFDISLNTTTNASNSYNLKQKLKMMPGSKLTINQGVTASFSKINIYNSSYEENIADRLGTKYPKCEDAELIVNGTMICDNIGGKIRSKQTGATVQINNGYSLTTYETTGDVSGSSILATIKFRNIDLTASFVHQDKNATPLTPTGKGVYTYINGLWTGPTA